jgi:hypothetical protein
MCLLFLGQFQRNIQVSFLCPSTDVPSAMNRVLAAETQISGTSYWPNEPGKYSYGTEEQAK